MLTLIHGIHFEISADPFILFPSSLGEKKELQNGQSIAYQNTMGTVMSDAIGITHSAQTVS